MQNPPFFIHLLCFVLSGLLPGCAAWHDLFQRDKPDLQTLARALSLAQPTTTDVAIVLGCPAETTGRPSACLMCRVHAAVSVYRAGKVRAVIFSGGAAHNEFIEAAVMARQAEQDGLPRHAIFLEPESLTTWQNLRFSRRIMEQNGFRTALLISARTHLPRARRFADYYEIPTSLAACEDTGPVL